MAVIYRKTDKVKIKIHDIEIALRPLTYHEKSEINALMVEGKLGTAAIKAVKLCLKDISGVKSVDDSNYELEIKDDCVSDDCIDDLMNMEYGRDIVLVCLKMLSGVPNAFVDEDTGEALEGISIVKEKKSRKK